ncbi:MAG: transcription-repair coupling factor [Alphaproteobacteria bacterium]|nr:transcription-repair coupling factor [Alphaproteobacteria bacterium]
MILARLRAAGPAPILHVARDDARMARMAEALAVFAPGVATLQFPAWDCLPYDRVSPHPEILARRIDTLTRLLEPQAEGRAPRILLTTVNALVQRVPPRAVFAGATMMLAPRQRIALEHIVAWLDANGYGRAGTVMEAGEYAVRGGLLDLVPAGREEPLRLDFFGDEIEAIRSFDPISQRSTATLDGAVLKPVSEVFLDPASVERFRTGYRDLFGAAASTDPLYEAVSARHRHGGMEHWLPLFHERMETLLDYLPGATITFDHQAEEVLAARLEMIADHYQARREQPIATRLGAEGELPYHAVPPGRLYLDHAGWEAMLSGLSLGQFVPFARPEGETEGAAIVDAGGRPGPDFAAARANADANVFETVREHAEAERRRGRRPVIAAWTTGARERLLHVMAEHGFRSAAAAADWAEIAGMPAEATPVVVLGLERGFTAPGLAVIGEQDILGERLARPARRRRRAEQFLQEATDLSEGDLVVHLDHGIGRYDGLVTLTVDGAAHDCLRVLYDGGDKLFVPVENIEVLSRFGSESAGVALDKLGGVSWQGRKARLKQRIRDMAAQLVRVAAERQLKPAPGFVPAEGSYDEFAARFPHAETEDQARAIAEVIEDLAAGRPMDRLVCGDVGFGKTEVALRAAFVVAQAGGQVAVVVPTTLLARQHHQTFLKRFAGLSVRIAQLSRMVSAKEAAAVKAGLADGTINIVVGTHALLGKGISFADLGLLIVDEEQHFGVAHKERLKQLKADVHVLTLTATPIPRTLQLALTGVREMSLISTPPVDRLAVRTFILPFDPVVVREAILRERFRGGQTFYVVPRIEDLDRVAERLRELVPEVKMVMAHGRMTPNALEDAMTAFGDGQYDVLLSTNIIESGLDMPAVNTLIVHRADMFGLSQLYQIRGRVGRAKQRGYAYLTLPANQKLSPAAEKRLTVMQSLDTLGAGFTLASHDLDIRGAGNLLGEEQSGHIREVGIELYQQMLEDAVAEIKAEGGKGVAPAAADWSPQINLGMSVLIPEAYVRELPVRLGLYRRIGNLATDAEIDAFAAELADRFGPVPPEVLNLLQVVAIKAQCRSAGVDRLEAGPKGAVLGFRNNAFASPAGLVQWLASQRGMARLRPDHKLVLAREMEKPEDRIREARRVLDQLAGVARRQDSNVPQAPKPAAQPLRGTERPGTQQPGMPRPGMQRPGMQPPKAQPPKTPFPPRRR